MAEYIEREALMQVLTRYLNSPHVQMGHSVGQGMRIAIKSCIELLDNEYAADVAPVRHGRWINHTMIDGHIHAECSECHKVRIIDNFCPNCGCRMDGGIE